ncbi:MAG: 1-deoxy-D-xylulose-5-phosphate reductoisomerase [Flavobacteriales bacterium]|nr:1-deoxy-D-xylulose-5-phosphate reductoisomerase [Flavobacteriales bacterium]
MRVQEKKHIAILGSTGSIGTQALEVIAGQRDHFEVEVLTAQNNAALLIEQAIAWRPNAVVIGNKDAYRQVSDALESFDIKVYAGSDALEQVVEMEEINLVLTALVGSSGLKPTLRAIRAGKTIALANKETLVVGGDIVTQTAREAGVNIYPIDSEHSAIFQCLAGEFHNPIEKVVLTASGGPFRGRKASGLQDIKPEQALNHPNWDMGAKVTIDSATLMNKGLEVIEARWLFGLRPEQIEVIVHPQSIIHSIVQFEDGSMKAQMGLPDMKLPIQYALGYPNRMKSEFPRFNFMQYPELTFESPDIETFRCLRLAFDAMKQGGNSPCVMNAANEIAVAAFLNEQIPFTGIPGVIEQCLAQVPFIAKPGLDDLLQTDHETRAVAEDLITRVKA